MDDKEAFGVGIMRAGFIPRAFAVLSMSRLSRL